MIPNTLLIDKDGKSLAGTVTESLGSVGSGGKYTPTYGYVPGEADKAVKADAALALKAALAGAEKMMGGATLQNIVDAILGDTKSNKPYGSKRLAKEIADNTYDKYLQKDGTLNSEGRREIMKANKLGAGQYFTYEGKTYKGNTGGANDFLPAILQKYDGGKITGPGTGTSDSIPAYLSNGEFVINAASAEKFGYANLERINKMAAGGRATKYNIPSYSMGGRINYEDGGAAFTRSNINVTVNAAPGMDERALADMVINRISTASRNLNSKTGEGLRA